MRSHGQIRRWVDGTPVHFTNFMPGVSPADRTSDVVQLLGKNGYWKPASSYKGTRLHAVCKMASCKCREGWTQWGNACYLAKKEMSIDWLSAREQCQQMEPTSDLATITSAAENRFVFRLAGGKDRIWIGLNDRVREGEFHWNNRSDGVEYTNWIRHSSQRNSHAKDCAYMTRGGKWIVSSCRQHGFYYACKQLLCGRSSEASPTRRGSDRVWRPEDSVRCPPGWSRSSSSAVDSALRPSCFSRPTAADTFAGVQSRCRAQHPAADVAVIRSLEDNDRAFLSAGALPMFIVSDDQFDMQEESASAGVGCVSLEPTGLWSSGRCAAGRLPGLCQMPACTPCCPNGWHLFQGQCYYVEERPLDAASAEAECRRAGSKLASIHSQEENDFIENLAFQRKSGMPKRTPHLWIGGRRKTPGADWVWSDCSDWNFWHWDITDGRKPAKNAHQCRRKHQHFEEPTPSRLKNLVGGCAAMRGTTGALMEYNRSDLLPYVCQARKRN
ncbi:macrophage mannose receptor 1-like [Amphibalanus amphitrite]|uniref:macrophage mannose receptor 1-like n=1 Tax=Amphibalanus amphitrite TaxID=1232801 RepID=UPI001C9211FB|nr:macrophage mannose receptor 1-like [Amphibalanus amphitrite]